MLTKLSLKARLDQSTRDTIELNSEVSCVRYLIGRIVKTYDYINRVVLTLPLSVYEGTWTHSPLSVLCITMILRVRRKFFEITTFPNTYYIQWFSNNGKVKVTRTVRVHFSIATYVDLLIVMW